MLNRCAVVVRPAGPFIAWAAALPDADPEIVPDTGDDQNVYLLPDLGDGADIDDLIAQVFDVIFENELAGWDLVEADWPQPRTWRLRDRDIGKILC